MCNSKRARLNNEDIKFYLTNLRRELRSNNTWINFRNPTDFRTVVAAALGIEDKDSFNTQNFDPQVVRRFANLFDVPVHPTQNEAATALQNFINRRANPWAHLSVSATEADPVASLIQAAG